MRARGGVIRGEAGSSTPLVIGIVACALLVCAALLPLYRGAVLSRTLAAAADSAALAGADSASGLEPGFPCERAAQAAALGGARLEACALDGGVVTVTVSGEVLGQRLRVEARAGPPICVWCA
jgi:secretion/DNA translocation related TadE-like protein